MLVELILLVASIVAPRDSALEFLTKGIRETSFRPGQGSIAYSFPNKRHEHGRPG